MRIATWNVNSLKARLEKVAWWLERAQPDVLLMQETKLADDDVPDFARFGYTLAHHGEGRWNGVAIATRGLAIDDVVTNFGAPDEARMIAARVGGSGGSGGGGGGGGGSGGGGVRVISIYAPNGREVGTPFYEAKLAWFAQLASWLERACSPDEPLVLAGDFNVAPTDADVWDPAACHGGTHVSPEERRALARFADWGLVDAYRAQHAEPERYTWWDYRAGAFQKNFGMRIDHCLVSRPVAARVVWSEIDREARKGKPIPSDHAPLVIDLDAPGRAFDAGWSAADARHAQRRAGPNPRVT
jgi:exodeoxyribonuclease III